MRDERREQPKSDVSPRLADFYIIGAMKCATSTLHDQLARRRRFFLSDPKEPNFFSDDVAYSRGLGEYAALFRDADPEHIVGESSTHYTKLPTFPHTVERIAKHTPNARFIYVMRDPLARIVSQYIHEWSLREVDVPIDEAVQKHRRFIAYSSYAYQLKPYLKTFGPDRILPVFFESLVDNPRLELERVARFVGDDSDEPFVWFEEAAQRNSSSERMRRSQLRDAISQGPVGRVMKRALPDSWKERIKSLWKMKGRPELSPEVERNAVRQLDEDLAELGQLLELSLDCRNFRAVARESQPVFRAGK